MGRVKPGEGALKPKNELCRLLGAQFRHYRERKQVRLEDLAKGMRRSINTIREHEAGSRPLRADDLIIAARFMQVRPGLLLSVSEDADV